MAKGPIALSAAKATLCGKIFKGQAARSARDSLVLLFGGRRAFRRQSREDFRQRKGNILQRRVKSACRRALFAQVQRCLLVVDDLRQVNLSFTLFAVLAEHSPGTCLLRSLLYFTVHDGQLAVAAGGQLPVVSGDQESHVVVVVEAEEKLMKGAAGIYIEIA